jgi:hypothetical protein
VDHKVQVAAWWLLKRMKGIASLTCAAVDITLASDSLGNQFEFWLAVLACHKIFHRFS